MYESLLSLFSLNEWVGEFTDPRKRLFWGYLLCAVLLAWLWSLRYPGLPSLWRREVWWSASARADLKLFAFNKILFFWLRPNLLTQSAVALSVYLFLIGRVDSAGALSASLSPLWRGVLFTLVLFVVDDFSRFLLHWLMHRIPSLWAFHRVHHSAEVLNPFTVLRTHPVEGVLFTFRSVLIQGSVVALALWLFGDDLSLQTVLGANVFVFVFHVLGSNLRHSPVPIRYPSALERWFISPAQHQLHHSIAPEHYDKNMGVALACWDRCFGTWHRSDATPVSVGVQDMLPDEHRLGRLLWHPFERISRQIRRRAIRFLKFPSKKGLSHEL